MGVGGRVESRREVQSSGILRGDPRGEQGKEHEDDDQHDAGCGQRIMARIAGNLATERDGWRGQVRL